MVPSFGHNIDRSIIGVVKIPSIVTGDCTRISFTIPFLVKGSGTNIKRIAIPGEQGWRNGESTCLPLLWPGFNSRTRRHMWVEFVVGSCPSSEGFSPGSLVFLPPQKSALLNSNSIWKQWMKSHLHGNANANSIIIIITSSNQRL